MSIEISFSDFRGFHTQNFVPVGKFTLLVGENSSGKTSFLAALKFLGDLFNHQSAADFNAEPFQLGTFEQIAHNRGGRAGRAKGFSISVRKRIPQSRRNRYTVVRLTFSPQEIGAFLSSVEVTSRSARLFVKCGDTDNTLLLQDPSKKLEWNADSFFFRVFGTNLSGSISFLLTNLDSIFGSNTEIKSNTWWRDFVEDVQKITNDLSRPHSATSAIRTRPLRTYTPGTDDEDGEGSHVPYELAKLARRRDKSEWLEMKQKIEEFGKNSEMFSEIDVKSFGKTMSDPFQIQFGVSGPKRNIVDLGYGTSQVLPILHGSISGGEEKRFLIQQPEVHLHPKAQAALGQFFIDRCAQGEQEFVLETHSDFIIDRVRMSVANDILSQSEVSLLFFTRERLENTIQNIHLDKNGDPVSPPQGYRSFFVDEQLRMLGV